MKEFNRTDRIGEQLQREIAVVVQQEVKDPRVGMVTISAVEVSRDLAHAKVYVTFLGREDQESIEQGLKGLEKAKGFIRSQVSHKMRLRIMPHLHFVYDSSIATGQSLSQLIDKARAKDQE